MTNENRPERQGSWFLTFTGTRFFPIDPRPEDVSIVDISHSLARICRFGGHTRQFYSVAEHCIHVSKLVPEEYALVGLLHDATEAYLGDVIKPLKEHLPEYKDIENLVWAVIAEKFGLPYKLPQDVHDADMTALLTEREYFINRDVGLELWREDIDGYMPDPTPIIPIQDFDKIENEYLGRYAEVMD